MAALILQALAAEGFPMMYTLLIINWAHYILFQCLLWKKHEPYAAWYADVFIIKARYVYAFQT